MKIIYTDGSARGNGLKNAKGGFGVVVCEVHGDESPENYWVEDVYSEQVEGTTNNRMEMSAILWALKNYGGEEHRGNGFLIPIVYSDSMYCVNSFTNWINGWKAKGWVRAGNKPLENLDLIKEWDRLTQEGFQIDLRYIKGHSGEVWNEVADNLATGKITKEEVFRRYKGKLDDELREEELEWARDLFGDKFSDEELLSRLDSEIRKDISLEE